MSRPAAARARPEVHVAETDDGSGVVVRFDFNPAAVDALKRSRTAAEWAAWLDHLGAWRVPRAVWRRAEHRFRGLGFDVVPLSMPDQDSESAP